MILPLAGFTASQGDMSLAAAIAWTTFGSVAGAVVLYWIGALIGRERTRAIAARLPLIKVSDIDRTEAWFQRHGRKTVFFGRMIPLFRSFFAIMFLWQVPHTLAIGTLYRDDYARAGIRVLPVVDWSGTSSGTHSVTNCLALLPVALMPTLVGMAGTIYFVVALLLSAGLLWHGDRPQALRRPVADARRLMLASLLYLPLLLGRDGARQAAALP